MTPEQQSGIEAQKNQPTVASAKNFNVFDTTKTDSRGDAARSIANDPTMIKLATEYKSSKEGEEIEAKATKDNNSKEAVDKFLNSGGYNEPIKNEPEKPTNVSDKKEKTVAIDSKAKSIIEKVKINENFTIDTTTGNIIIKTKDGQNVRTLDPNNPENKKRITTDGIQKWVNRYTGTK